MILTETKIDEGSRRKIEQALKEINALESIPLKDAQGNKLTVRYPRMAAVVDEEYPGVWYSISRDRLKKIWCDIDVAYINGLAEERSVEAMRKLIAKFMDANKEISVCGFSMDEVGDFCILVRPLTDDAKLQLQPYMYELSIAPGCEQWKHQNITIVE